MTTRDDHTQTTQTTQPTTTQPTEATVAVSVNGARREISAGSTLDTLVAALTSAPSGVAAAVNETVVPRGTWQRTVLRAGDRVEVLTAVQGG
ncbi:sulfur carrier protein ThiS [Streptomyces apocyni]|uniref:sulfur carrier protein ThiS n=1 Tax=Streptomyces apocyni TaxID=2654677 RepID=UPI0012E9FDAF|nr:sulfur carrier protein ThiS [Streptomyces apocyni]